MYEYLIVGSGLFGCVFAREATRRGKRCLVVERRDHTGGNIRCENVEGVTVHRYGPHIFHTADRRVWDYVNALVPFDRFTNSPLANYKGEIYNLPFNMNTFRALWGVTAPEEARAIIDSQRAEIRGEPRNLEEQAISLVGRDVYEKLIKGYTEKQWGRECRELPAFIIRRLPVRFTYDNNYFNDPFQGIPRGGYNALTDALLQGVEVRLNTDYLKDRAALSALAKKTVYTGMLDAYFDCRLGRLQWRSLRFETEVLPVENYQGVAVMNFTDRETPFTRRIEHKHFAPVDVPHTVITREYPAAWQEGQEPYYPVNDSANDSLAAEYRKLAADEPQVFFGGRLAEYKYYDMDKVIASALALAERELTEVTR